MAPTRSGITVKAAMKLHVACSTRGGCAAPAGGAMTQMTHLKRFSETPYRSAHMGVFEKPRHVSHLRHCPWGIASTTRVHMPPTGSCSDRTLRP
jgi:hypothetical protein